MSEESPLFETSLRDRERMKAFRARHQRISKLKQQPMSVRQTLESGQEGRLFTSSAAGADEGVTRPINDQAVDATPVEIGRTLYVQEEIKEAQAAERAPLPLYAQPFDEFDPRALPDLDARFPTEASFLEWCQETNASPETIARIAATAQEQQTNKRAIAEIQRQCPTWQEDLPALVEWAKREKGLTDADPRVYF